MMAATTNLREQEARVLADVGAFLRERALLLPEESEIRAFLLRAATRYACAGAEELTMGRLLKAVR